LGGCTSSYLLAGERLCKQENKLITHRFKTDVGEKTFIGTEYCNYLVNNNHQMQAVCVSIYSFGIKLDSFTTTEAYETVVSKLARTP
jgi:hypothetical protein